MGTCKEYDQTVNIWAFRLKNKDMLNHPDFSDLPVLLLQVVVAVHIDNDHQFTLVFTNQSDEKASFGQNDKGFYR